MRQANTFGLPDESDTKYLNGIALGWLPDFEVPDAVSTINKALDKPIAVIGDYVQIYANEEIGKPDRPPLAQIDWHLDNVSAGNPETQPVYMITLMPEGGFEAVTPKIIDLVAAKMKELNDKGITVWLRYAHEMNLNPYKSSQLGDFIKSWIAMHKAIKEGAPCTYMLWSPNADVKDPPDYMTYYPGAEYVDLHGLSLYPFHLGGRDRNDTLKGGEFHKLFTPFYDVFGKLPLVISETSKSYNYEEKKYPTDPLPGTAIHMEAQSKVDWFAQMTCLATKKAFPNLLSVIWFEYLKDEEGMTVDFRSLTGSHSVKKEVAAYLKSQD